MPTSSDRNGIVYPVGTDDADMQSDMAALVGGLDTRLFSKYADASERDAAIPSPSFGDVCAVASFNLPMFYYTAYWGFFPGTPLATLYASTEQPITSGGTGVAVELDSEEFDTLNGHDTVTNNSRYVGLIPGRYMFTSGVTFNPNATGVRQVQLVKNGLTVLGPLAYQLNSGATYGMSLNTTGIVSLNGTTDYVQTIAYQDSGSTITTATVGSIGFASTMTVTYMGSA